ncbi:hypothetical protein MATL_G00007650 [Megalops atlanticus]|uniref:Uncharacterized protein n=1 Tax=Megalops atlanticus TaxID=7932 RepID=A0A9D3TL30_MEGAT|nr:hypothetical protein MATL_G00007650 [Megalops atlanticus]
MLQRGFWLVLTAALCIAGAEAEKLIKKLSCPPASCFEVRNGNVPLCTASEPKEHCNISATYVKWDSGKHLECHCDHGSPITMKGTPAADQNSMSFEREPSFQRPIIGKGVQATTEVPERTNTTTGGQIDFRAAVSIGAGFAILFLIVVVVVVVKCVMDPSVWLCKGSRGTRPFVPGPPLNSIL